MYIIAIGWLFVVILMAVTETNLVAAAMTLIFYGLFPVGILIYLFGRRRGGSAREATRKRLSQQAVDHVVGEPDGHDAGHDQ